MEIQEYLNTLQPNTKIEPEYQELLKNTENVIIDGSTLLHLAAKTGNIEACSLLIQYAKIPWNSLANNKSVGEIAMENGHLDLYEYFVDTGCRSEFILSLLGQKIVEDGDVIETKDKVVANQGYLNRKLYYSKGKLLDSDGNAVMMGWETPLMKIHSDIICKKGKKILNVGFGLGIIDKMIQESEPELHTIIEAHPDVYQKMVDDGWTKLPNVTVLFGRWQDVLVDYQETFDGIFFDTFGEYYDDLHDFHQILPNILDEDGVYTFFNGLCGTNQFFHDVSCRIVELELREIGFNVEFKEVAVDELGDEVWKDTKRAYWSLPTYRVPTVTFDF
ncbi:hypothetical protein HDV06_004841 [Boothiomyces sp. JEL0866]|nr:hypothetical protein HDV06_004841 [Boothiomyces sp. JEL0866]